MVRLEAAGLSDIGRRRSNQDAFLVDTALGLFIVADGMGGHRAGEVASALVVQTLKDYLKRFAEGGGAVEELEDADPSLSRQANRLAAAIRLANAAVYDRSQSDPGCRGMGSTVSAVLFTDTTCIVANVGDSPAYLARGGKAFTLSVPHTVLAESGADPQADGEPSAFANMLTRAVGVDEDVSPDLAEMQTFAGDVLALCSDGLSNKVSREEIAAAFAGASLEAACRSLVRLALMRGGSDNVTIVAVRLDGSGRGFGRAAARLVAAVRGGLLRLASAVERLWRRLFGRFHNENARSGRLFSERPSAEGEMGAP